MKTFSFSLVLALTVGLMPIAYGSTNVFNAVTSGGLGGTDWLQYANKHNWAYPDRSSGYAQDDELGFGNAILDNSTAQAAAATLSSLCRWLCIAWLPALTTRSPPGRFCVAMVCSSMW